MPTHKETERKHKESAKKKEQKIANPTKNKDLNGLSVNVSPNRKAGA